MNIEQYIYFFFILVQQEINTAEKNAFDYPVLMSIINAIDIVVVAYFSLEYGLRFVFINFLIFFFKYVKNNVS